MHDAEVRQHLNRLMPSRVHRFVFGRSHREEFGQFHPKSHRYVGFLADDTSLFNSEQGELRLQSAHLTAVSHLVVCDLRLRKRW